MPNTIAQNLARLQTARTDIANAITEMGGTVNTGDGFEAFPADIATIPTGGGAYNLTFTSSAFGSTVSTNKLFFINSDSSTSVFGYLVIKSPNYITNREQLEFSFDSASTPSFTSGKLDRFSISGITGNVTGGISREGKYLINISTGSTNIYSRTTYEIYIQSLFV